MPFTFHDTPLHGVVLVESRIFPDDRGYFREGFKASEFAAAGLPTTFPQDNTSRSRRGVIRGLHFQTNPRAQGKLVSVAAGSVFDVAVDLRHGSPSFGRWFGAELTEDNGRMLWIPAGFAHGFSVLSASADLVYKCTDEFSAANDGGIAWNDPQFAVDWQVDTPIVSAKDEALPTFEESDPGFQFTE